ncbi:anhydro-N-acetylmuramic acid kinase [Galbibacter sp. EGI 63066]|uniref:anhydro-N-acetylmuramic acid kinase n=1 Tax=Galbibacter sp. EGI 63066 TaxID=2993559 RepID=UPI00224995DF|nr:anhydro-N-acetylmuramic acid kinase [Galbibacter sp. EGI 63066]MCX2679655.1 anhydro-N-acetylmuramic acid kinase [Galbibacter sp. EGI 63066]
MKKNYYNVVGVMSGTSLDGIDLVNVRFENKASWSFDVICCETIPYNDQWRNRLKNAIHLSQEALEKLDKEYTIYLADVISDFISKNNLSDIDFVASHGHTVFHEPEKGITYQIGNLPCISEKTGKTVVCDFRVDDVKLGGQGAPLVPVGDKLLFAEYDFCLNIGGFANVSTKIGDEYKAFDICAANNVLNHYVATLGFEYDDGGKIASTGEVNNALLDKLNDLPFYKKPYPKSLGIEWVEQEVLPMIDAAQASVEAVLRTYVEHIAIQIAAVLKPSAKVLVTGGGAYNNLLMQRLKDLSKADIVIPEKAIIEFKEAIIFGFLGVLKMRNEVNCLKSITGSSKDHSSGKIYKP